MAIPLKLVTDKTWSYDLDPYIRLQVALIETEPKEDCRALLCPRKELDVLAELRKTDGKFRAPAGLKVPTAYNERKFVAGTVDVDPDDPELRTSIATLRKGVERLKLSVRQQPRLLQSVNDVKFDMSPPSRLAMRPLDRRDRVIIGIIDDGCAFAHYNFLNIKREAPFEVESRILYLWDQTDIAPSAKWCQPKGFTYGRVLTQPAIDEVLARHVDPRTGYLREDAVYEDEDVGYPIEVGSHGTHVMDIAAGNGNSGTSPGVAPNADIIFVQIPKTAIGHAADSVLTGYLLDGIRYIFSQAGDRPAVVNISYGGYGGPHDGTSLFERAMDDLLDNSKNRAIVISAGNAFDVNCHATDVVEPKTQSMPLRWLIGADDPTLNMMEIWYDGKTALKLELTPPSAVAPLEIGIGDACSIRQGEKIVGWVFHRKSDPHNNDNHILIALRPSVSDATGENVAPAPAGTWVVQLSNEGAEQVAFHAWIERDDAGNRNLGKKLQSSFAPDDASPECTLGSFATGRNTIIVGAYNTATQEICSYSAAGPTRDGRTEKPDVCAPAEEDVAGNGVMCATSLSAQPTAMNGTSAAAPHVAGLVALVLEEAQRDGTPLAAHDIRKLIVEGASDSEPRRPKHLQPNSRSLARDQLKPSTRASDQLSRNSGPPQSRDFREARTGAGRISAAGSLKSLARMKRRGATREK
jgi:subtilisin family serine protease